jgi:mannose-6-phosphate isomerase-like protein (cupin superfamily)
MKWEDRAAILRSIWGVWDVIAVDDNDSTVCNGIYTVSQTYANHNLVFCNGGDRYDGNTPETALCQGLGIELAWNVGGGKTSSSSHLLSTWSNEPVERSWGQWRVFQNYTGIKVKELTIRPQQKTSLQKHQHREEMLNIISGKGYVTCSSSHWTFDQMGTRASERLMLTNFILDAETISGRSFTVSPGTWHQINNPFDTDLVIVEIQRGLQCVEEDIIRADLDNPDEIPSDLQEILKNTRDIYAEWNSQC